MNRHPISVKIICFQYFQTSFTAAVTAGAAAAGQEGKRCSNEARDAGEEDELAFPPPLL